LTTVLGVFVRVISTATPTPCWTISVMVLLMTYDNPDHIQTPVIHLFTLSFHLLLCFMTVSFQTVFQPECFLRFLMVWILSSNRLWDQPYSICTGVPSTHQSTAEVKNEWNHTSTSPIRLHGMNRNTTAFSSIIKETVRQIKSK
jgi:hypothetical protein